MHNVLYELTGAGEPSNNKLVLLVYNYYTLGAELRKA